MSKSERAEARTRATLERGAAKRPGAPAPTRANETSESERAEARTRATLERGAAERPGAPAPTRANETQEVSERRHGQGRPWSEGQPSDPEPPRRRERTKLKK